MMDSMSVIQPPREVATRWRGAKHRLQRSPLESFIRRNQLPFAPTQADDCRNVQIATTHLISGALEHDLGPADRDAALPLLVQLACSVALGVGSVIKVPSAARIAGLASASQLLRAQRYTDIGARVAAPYQDFHDGTFYWSELCQVRDLAATAVLTNDSLSLTAVRTLVRAGLVHVWELELVASNDTEFDVPASSISVT
jgi:hypothetical protein